MKLLRKSIDMIAAFDTEGNLMPIRFKYLDDQGEALVIKVDRVIKKDIDKFAGNRMIKYTCESCVNGEIRPFELRYELDTCKWFLYKG